MYLTPIMIMNIKYRVLDAHPNHNQITQAVRAWFHDPFDAMGICSAIRRWGTYWTQGAVYLAKLAQSDAPAFLADLQEFYPRHQQVTVVTDCPVTAQILSDALRTELTNKSSPTPSYQEATDLFLAHTGAMPGHAACPALEIVAVDDANLHDSAHIPLLAFADTEKAPDQRKVDNGCGENRSFYLAPNSSSHSELSIVDEVARRRIGMEGNERGLLAKVAGEPVGLLWSTEKAHDVWIHLLGVRKPFRRRGIAHALLKHRVGSAYSAGFRSVVINVRADNTYSLRLCRRLGFRDEVYRQRRYRLLLNQPT